MKKYIILMWLITTVLTFGDIPKEVYPKWWDSRNVVTDDISNDFTPINQGQVKHFFMAAYDEIKELWPEGDPAIDLIMDEFTPDRDYNIVNVGQLKHIVTPFYDFRSTFGIGDPYPWEEIAGYDNDYAMANGGDLKEFFFWELPATTNFIYVSTNGTGIGTIDDPMGDLREVLLGRAGPGVNIIVRGGEYWFNLTGTNFFSGTYSAVPMTFRGFNNEMPTLSTQVRATGWVRYAADIWMIENYEHEVQQLFYHGTCLDTIGHVDYHSEHDPVYRDTYLFDVEAMYPGTFMKDEITDRLYVYLPDSSEPPVEGLLVCQDFDALIRNMTFDPIYANGYNVQYKRMRWRGGGELPTGFDTARTGYNTTLWNMDIQWMAGVSLYYYSNSRYIRSNISNMGKGGFVGSGAYNSIVYGCTLTNINYRGYTAGWDSGGSKFFSPTYDGYGSIFDDCYIANGKGEGIWFDMLDPLKRGRTNIVRNCVVENVIIGIISEASSGSLFYNNVVIGNYYGIELNATRDSIVANNTIINTYNRYSIYLSQADVRNPVTNNIIVNNLIYMDNATTYAHAFPMPDGHMYDNIVDYNCYYKPGHDTLFYGSTLDEQHSWGREIHTLTNNPKLIYPSNVAASDLGGGLFLDEQSLCIDAGTNLPWLVKDRLGRWRTGGNDIGAYEYIPGDGSSVGYVWGLQRNTIPMDLATIDGNLSYLDDDIIATLIVNSVTSSLDVVVNERDYTWSVDSTPIEEGVDSTLIVNNTTTSKPTTVYSSTMARGGVGTGEPIVVITNIPDQLISGDLTAQGTINEHVEGNLQWILDYGPYYQSNDHVIVSGSIVPVGNTWSVTIPESNMLEGMNTFKVIAENTWDVKATASHILDYGITTEHYADPDSPNPTYPYLTPETAARRVMDACGSAWHGDTVWLADGTYDSGVTIQGISGKIRSRAEILRGFTLRSINGPDNCIIKGQVKYDYSGYRPILRALVGIRGLHVEHSDAKVYGVTCAYGDWYAWGGGGIFVDKASVISNCVFRNNVSRKSTSGGAVSLSSPGDLVFTDNIIRDNDGADGSIVGLYVTWATLANIRNLDIYGNNVDESITVKFVNATQVNNIIVHDNLCDTAVSIGYSSTLYNSTIVDNTASIGGLYFNNEGVGHTYAYNTIVTDNGGTVTVSPIGSAVNHIIRCLVDGFDPEMFNGTDGTFIGLSDLDATYTPLVGSLALDAGTNVYPSVDFNYDFYNNPRIMGSAIDIGAVEYIDY